MDKLDAYLDRVCRGIAGPRSLRQHIRQELKEHLKDAAAEHAAAGMGEEEALARAIEEFGGPEEVRAELEATHGQRWVTVLIDKAMSWKEKTMKARWVWSTWAHAVLLLMIAMEVFFFFCVMVFILPKFKQIFADGSMPRAAGAEGVIDWGLHYLGGLASVAQWWFWLLIVIALGWVFFERTVKSENKTLMRLTKLGTIAAGLLVLVWLAAAAMVLPLIVSYPDLRRVDPVDVMADHQRRLDRLVVRLEGADPAMKGRWAEEAAPLVKRLRDAAAWLETSTGGGPAGAAGRYDRALAALEQVQSAVAENNRERTDAAVRQFRDAYGRPPAYVPATLPAGGR